MRLLLKRERGFTLVEAIVVMVITAILAGIMVLFIRRPVQSYIDTSARADMADVAEVALRRMARELRGAVPNSIRLSSVAGVTLLEFIPSVAGGRYLDANDGTDPNDPAFPPFVFANTNAPSRFYVVTPMPAPPYAIAPGDFIIVYNLGNGIVGSDAYEANAANRFTIEAGGVNGKVITVGANPLAGSAISSPNRRFIVARRPVTFACVGNANGTGTLARYTNYGFRANQPSLATLSDPTAGASMALMAANVQGCSFTVRQLANRNTALIGLAIALARPSPGGNGLETATLAQQIQVNNTP